MRSAPTIRPRSGAPWVRRSWSLRSTYSRATRCSPTSSSPGLRSRVRNEHVSAQPPAVRPATGPCRRGARLRDAAGERVSDQPCAFDLALVLFAGGEPNLARVGRLHSVCARRQADCAMAVGGVGWLGVLLSVPSGKRADGGVLLSSRWRSSRSGEGRLRRSFFPLAVFIAIFSAFNVWASANAARDDIWSRKTIYLFYASQGWTEVFEPGDRGAAQAADHESAGFARAIQLYGKPAENSESMLYSHRAESEGLRRAHCK